MNLPWEAIISLFIYIIGSTIGFVWWMATITQQLKTLTETAREMSTNNGFYARKDDVARELALIEKQVETMWGRFDRLKEKVDSSIK